MAETLDSASETLDGVNNGSEAKWDVQSPNSSLSGSDSDEDDEDLQLETLEKDLSENPSSYDAHLKYIQCLRKLGHIEKLREARESMNLVFPLSPKMWQEWAKDEASLSAGSETSATIEKLYERGVHEYLSVSLWCDYINYVQEHDQSVSQRKTSGISKMRDLFECALTAAGIHVIEGSKIWEAYREFEQAILLTIDDNDSEEKAKQIHRIRGLFHRQLSVPLANAQSTLVAYKLWEVEQGNINEVTSDDFDGIPSNVISAYQKAIQMYKARVHYEDQLSSRDVLDAERLQHYMTYIKFEESYGDPARVQILYERSVTEFPIASDLWLDYTRYLDTTLKVPSVLKSVYSKATRNCPWIGKLWVQYLLSLERVGGSDKELSPVFTQSLQCSFSSFEEYLDLFLTRIDGLRRRISQAGATEDDLDYVVIRDTFKQAVDFLSPYLKNTDALLLLHAYWARLELNLGKDLVAARGVWESLIKTSGSMLEVWRGYIAMEIENGHLNEARSIYKRCYTKRFSGTGSEDICHSWLRFEREFGALDDFDHALKKVMPRLEELQLFRSQQESKTAAASTDQKENPHVKKSSQKRKTGSKSTDEQPPSKRQKDESQKLTKSFGREIAQKDTAQRSAEVNGKGLAEASHLSQIVEPETTNEPSVGDSTSKETKSSFYTDKCTAFISNISLEAKEEQIRKFFSDSGGVTAIRLLRDKFTHKSRGLAYVDFSDEARLAAALAKNKLKLLGQKLSIARSDPKQSQKRGPSGRSSSNKHDGSAPSGDDHVGTAGERNESSVSHRRAGQVQFTGKNTFAMPRAVVKPLGWTKSEPRNEEGEDTPKSNDEFRKMLLKK